MSIPDNRFEQIDKLALREALIALRVCPKCRGDLRHECWNGPSIEVVKCEECGKMFNASPLTGATAQ